MTRPQVAAQPEQVRVLVGGSSTTSSYYAHMVTEVDTVMKYNPDLLLTLLETGGATDNAKRMIAGQVDIGSYQPPLHYQALAGIGPWKDAGPQPNNLRGLLITSQMPYAFWVTEASGITSLDQLNGKKFSVGMPGSGGDANVRAILGYLGITPDWFEGRTADAVEALKNREIVGWFKVLAGMVPDAPTMDIMSRQPLRILGLTPAQAAKIRKDLPHLELTDVPAGAIKGFESMGAFVTSGSSTGLGAKVGLSTDAAYKIVKSLVEHPEKVTEAYQAAQNFDWVKVTISSMNSMPDGVYLHPGAIKYFREINMDVPARLVPPEIK